QAGGRLKVGGQTDGICSLYKTWPISEQVEDHRSPLAIRLCSRVGLSALHGVAVCQLQYRTRERSLSIARNPPIVTRDLGPAMRLTRWRQRPEASRKRSPTSIAKLATSNCCSIFSRSH